MTLSVIIPIYNVEKMLRRCVDSVRIQGFDDIEILLINDGSTDGSGIIAEEYAATYKNIKYWKKENGGLSDARNFGIERAEGDYITFVDSDDELAPNTYSPLIALLQEHPFLDILEYPMLQRPGLRDETLFNPGNHLFKDALDWLAYKGTEHCWACNKIYKRSLFNNVAFEKGKKFEDILLMALLIKQKPIIATIDKGRYLYHYNDNGIAATDKSNGLSSLLDAQLHLVSQLNINTRERRWHRVYMDMLTAQLYSYQKTGKIRLAQQHVSLFGYATWKDILKAMFVNTIGLERTCRLFGRMKR